MAYLGITDNGYKGLYYFDSLSVRDRVGEVFENPSYYTNGQKEQAFKDFNISEDTVIDGGELIRKLRKEGKFIPEDAKYLVIGNGPYMGVYFFNTLKMRDAAAGFFGSAATIVESREGAMKACPMPRFVVKDGGNLLSKESREWRRTHHHLIGGKPKYLYDEKPVVEEPKKEEKVNEKPSEPVQEEKKKVTEPPKQDKVTEDKSLVPEKKKGVETDKKVEVINLEENKKFAIVQDILKDLSECNDLIEIMMSNGISYFVTVNALFYVPPSFEFDSALIKDEHGNSMVDTDKIAGMIEDGTITAIGLSELEFKGNFIVLKNVDDTYSPNPVLNEFGHTYFQHGIKKVVINITQIVSIMPVEDFNGMTWKKISSENCELISDFMYENYTVAN